MKTKINEINKKIASALKRNKITLAAAESCTGGLFSDYVTNLAGSSEYFKGAVIAYSNESKIKTLKVSKKTLINYGAVSPETALKMAVGAKKVFSSDIALSVTGIAGPGGGSKDKPVGLVYVGFIDKNNVKNVKKLLLKGCRASIKLKAVKEMLSMLYDSLE